MSTFFLFLMVFSALMYLALSAIFALLVRKNNKSMSVLYSIWANDNELTHSELTKNQALLWNSVVASRWIAAVCGMVVLILKFLPIL